MGVLFDFPVYAGYLASLCLLKSNRQLGIQCLGRGIYEMVSVKIEEPEQADKSRNSPTGLAYLRLHSRKLRAVPE